MSRQAKQYWALLLIAAVTATGCTPTQPFYFHEDGDLSHYINTATEIEFPDATEERLAEAAATREPLSLTNPHFDEIWELSLEEAVCVALKNGKVLRNLGGVAQLAAVPPEQLLRSPQQVPTVYDPALTESSPGSVGSGSGVLVPGFGTQHGAQAPGAFGAEHPEGVEAALAAFDARLAAGMFWERTDRPQNVDPGGFGGNIDAIFPRVSFADQSRFNVQLSKRAATGSEFFVRTNAIYNDSNQTIRALPSDWLANLEMEARHPFMRGGGVQVNRMNVILARINTDLSLADFELGVRNMVADIEQAYWDLYFQYRNLDTKKVARDSALVTWKKINALKEAGAPGGEAEKEAQARQQYFRFRSEVESALRDLFKVENRLRYLMGIAATDGRLIRPSDEPTAARVNFEWQAILAEALYRSPELRKQKWQIKRREMQLITARNDLLPRLDAVALYRWLGAGDELIGSNRRGLNFPAEGSRAWEELFEGNYQEWALGFQFEMPIGFRQALSGVRYYQLHLARERARLEDMELEVSHSLTDRLQSLEAWYQLAVTNFNWRVAAQKEVDAVQAAYDAGTVTLDVLLDAQQRRADAEIAFHNSLIEYNKAIMQIHFRKGSLLEYNGIALAEGPWPAKAYFDAHEQARRRDASYYLDYGYTRPRVISQGPVESHGEAVGAESYDVPMYPQGAWGGQYLPETIAPGTPVPSPPMPVPDDDFGRTQRPGSAPATVGSPPALVPALVPARPASASNEGRSTIMVRPVAAPTPAAAPLKPVAARPASGSAIAMRPAAVQPVAHQQEESVAREPAAASAAPWKSIQQ